LAPTIEGLLSGTRPEKQAAIETSSTRTKQQAKAKQETLQQPAVAEAEQQHELSEAGAAVIRQKFAGDRAALDPYLNPVVWSQIGTKLASEPKPKSAQGDVVIDLQRVRNDGLADTAYGLLPLSTKPVTEAAVDA
jgi:hypothetical protein